MIAAASPPDSLAAMIQPIGGFVAAGLIVAAFLAGRRDDGRSSRRRVRSLAAALAAATLTAVAAAPFALGPSLGGLLGDPRGVLSLELGQIGSLARHVVLVACCVTAAASGISRMRRSAAIGFGASLAGIASIAVHWHLPDGWIGRLGIESGAVLPAVALLCGIASLAGRRLIASHSPHGRDRTLVSAAAAIGVLGLAASFGQTETADAMRFAAAAATAGLISSVLRRGGVSALAEIFPAAALVAASLPGASLVHVAAASTAAAIAIAACERLDRLPFVERLGMSGAVAIVSLVVAADALPIAGLMSTAVCSLSALTVVVSIGVFANEQLFDAKLAAADQAATVRGGASDEVERDAMLAQLAQRDATIESLRADQERAESERAAIATDREAERETDRATIRERDAAIVSLREQVSELEDRLASVRQSGEESEAALRESLNAAEATIASQRLELEEVRVDGSDQNIEAVDASRRERDEAIAEAESLRDELKAAAHDRDAQRLRADETATQLEEAEAALAEAAAEAEADRERHAETVRGLEDAVSSADAERQEIETELREATEEITALQTKIAEREASSITSDAATEAICEQQRDQIQRLMRDLAAAREHLHTAEQSPGNRAGELEAAKTENLSLRDEIADLRLRIDELMRPAADATPIASREFIDRDELLTLCMDDLQLTRDLLRQLQSDLPESVRHLESAIDAGDVGEATAALSTVTAFATELPLPQLRETVTATNAAMASRDAESVADLLPTLCDRINGTIARSESLLAELA